MGEMISFIRTVENIPDIFRKKNGNKKKDHYIHELGYMSNLSPDYEGVIADGLFETQGKC